MKLLIAPDAFCDDTSALSVAQSIAQTLSQTLPEAQCHLLPMADCRVGMAQTLIDATGGTMQHCRVQGPLGQPVSASYALIHNGKTAAIEIAEASGLKQLRGASNRPLRACSFGAGELILDALKHGVSNIILALDETATLDGGMGMMRALGVRFLDVLGRDVGVGGAALIDVERIDATGLTPMLDGVNFEIACEVATCLAGPTGAPVECGAYKGASREDIQRLDECLHSFADVLGRDIADRPGAGAAGGIGAVAMTFLTTRMRRGVDIIAEAVDFGEHLSQVDLVITAQSDWCQQQPSTVATGVARLAMLQEKPCVALTPHNSPLFPAWIGLQSTQALASISEDLAATIRQLATK